MESENGKEIWKERFATFLAEVSTIYTGEEHYFSFLLFNYGSKGFRFG